MAWFIVQSLITLVLAFALGIVVGWLVWARRRPADAGADADLVATKKQLAAAEEQLAACACDIEAEPAADVDLDAGDDVDPSSEEVDADLDVISTAQDVDVEELVATYRALEEIDTDLDSPTVSAVEADADDVAALAVAVGALSATADDDVQRDDPDDIERIEGIGPKIGKALRAAGLDTYTAVADASPESLREAVKAGGVKFAPSVESWPSQARLLADGDEAGFQALTGRLVAGRVKG